MFIVLPIFLIIAYLLGSLSSAIIVCKIMGLPDPRTQGSGNPGATNVLRIGGKQAAIIVLLGDALKGFIPVFLAHILGVNNFALGLVALAALLGHLYPLFFNFQGGKGVATGIGAMFGISFVLGLVAIIVWGVVALISRYVAYASCAAIGVATLLSPWITSQYGYFIPLLIISFLVVWRHQDNFQRIRAGTEKRIGA
jgi:glycerol-3-phosphate acyltransferase PlsY